MTETGDEPTWASVFERAPDGVTVSDVRDALETRREE